MRSTSLEAYRTIKENGLLTKARMEVADVLIKELDKPKP